MKSLENLKITKVEDKGKEETGRMIVRVIRFVMCSKNNCCNFFFLNCIQ